jgi:hypothetical protein
MRSTVDTPICKGFDKAKTATMRNIAYSLQISLDVKEVYLEEEVENYIAYLKTAKHE